MCVCKQISPLLIVLVMSNNICFAQTTPLTAGIITTLAGDGTKPSGFSGDGLQAFNATLNRPVGMALDIAGNTYITDTYNNRIRRVARATQIITTIAGTGTAGFTGDGGMAVNAQINHPTDICIDESGSNLYFVDSLNFRVRRIDLATGIISTIAGNGTTGYTGQTTPAINASIGGVSGLVPLYSSTLFISLGASGRICLLDLPTGMLSTFAGTGSAGFSGDGGAAINASFNFPAGLGIDRDGAVYVADCFNHRIRKIDTSGIIKTVAGNGVAGFSGDTSIATAASLNFPHGIFIDRAGNYFIADKGNHRIREVYKKTGKIYTVAGSGTPGFAGDGAYANTSCVKLFSPTFVRTDDAGALYIVDNANNCIRKVNRSLYVHIGFQMASPGTDTLATCPGTAGISIGYGSTTQPSVQSIQFYVNGIPVASSGAQLFTTLYDGDIIYAYFSFYTNCEVIHIISDPVFVKMFPVTDPDITIMTSAANICTPAPVTFTANTVDAGTKATFDRPSNLLRVPMFQ